MEHRLNPLNCRNFKQGFLQPYIDNKTREENLNDGSETPKNCDIHSPTYVVEDGEESLNMQQGLRSARDEALYAYIFQALLKFHLIHKFRHPLKT